MTHPYRDTARIENVTDKALEAFWQVVGNEYPEATSGDYPPDATFEQSAHAAKHIRQWLTWNVSAKPLLTPAQAMVIGNALSDPNTSANTETNTESASVTVATFDECDRAGIEYPDGRIVTVKTLARDLWTDAPITFVMVIDADGVVRSNWEVS